LPRGGKRQNRYSFCHKTLGGKRWNHEKSQKKEKRITESRRKEGEFKRRGGGGKTSAPSRIFAGFGSNKRGLEEGTKITKDGKGPRLGGRSKKGTGLEVKKGRMP